jgi:hypothetical protein
MYSSVPEPYDFQDFERRRFGSKRMIFSEKENVPTETVPTNLTESENSY